MRAALVVGDGVNFVDDDGFDGAENFAALRGGEQNVERFGRGDQNVRRACSMARRSCIERVAGAHGGANLRHQEAALAGELQNFAERSFEIFLNVVAERLERRDVEDFGVVGQFPAERFAHEAVDASEKCGERFARTGGRGDERGFAGEDVRPALFLRLGGRAEAGDEPLADERVSPFQAGESRLRNVGVHDAELNYSATGPVAADRGNEKEAFERMHLAEIGRNVLRPAWVRKRCARKEFKR